MTKKKFLIYCTILFLIFRIAKLKGITSGPPSECGDDEKPKQSKRSSKNCENTEGVKFIDYKGML